MNIGDIPGKLIRTLLDRNRFLEEENIRLEQMLNRAKTDSLTGLMTRFSFSEDYEFQQRRRPEALKSVSVIFFDVDNFKRVNDEFGHSEGDDLLVALSSIILSRVRSTDFAVRWGGDEILLVLPGSDTEDAEAVVHEISAAFKVRCMRYNFGRTSCECVSLSAGIASGTSVIEMIASADERMYERKKAHKNHF